MRPYFTRERFGRPQFLAGLLLLCFLGQALWLVHAELRAGHEPDWPEEVRIGEGWKQWHGRGVAAAPYLNPDANIAVTLDSFDTEHSPLLYLVSAGPLLAWPKDFAGDSAQYWRWLPRIPFLACGVFLGASLWYVARRLCGNRGGFVALTFYCFSPSLIQASAAWHTEPEIVAAWGAFGTVFTAIAVAHTLYAPREVVLWNWRRIVLMGLSIAVCIGAQFSLWILLVPALAYMLWVGHVRPGAALVIFAAACVTGLLLLCAVYGFRPVVLGAALRNADWLEISAGDPSP